jgi:hypothetical protein
MPYPQDRKDRSPNNPKGQIASLVLRLDRAANDINPFLAILAAGLLVLNITLYLGMMVAREPFLSTQPHHDNSPASPPAAFNGGSSVGTAGN